MCTVWIYIFTVYVCVPILSKIYWNCSSLVQQNVNTLNKMTISRLQGSVQQEVVLHSHVCPVSWNMSYIMAWTTTVVTRSRVNLPRLSGSGGKIYQLSRITVTSPLPSDHQTSNKYYKWTFVPDFKKSLKGPSDLNQGMEVRSPWSWPLITVHK